MSFGKEVVYGECSILKAMAHPPPRIGADRLPCLLYNKDLNAFWAGRPKTTSLVLCLNRFYRYLIDTKGKENVDVRPRWLYLD